ncbi:MAG TPA: LacI family DNA-binding transcriptional regulator [Acidobacteriaceae bacterium]|nr:LacI family DNA-binding transcriptional regulator [Acidobacteriaceae bacterium]
MPTKGEKTGKLKPRSSGEPVSLKQLAEYLSLNPATVSVVLNDVPGRSIPQPTRERIKAAALKLGYQPNLLARSLRNRKTHTIGVLVPELTEDYHTQIMGGIGDSLMSKGYFYFTVHHRHRKDLVEEYGHMLINRAAEGLIAIDTALEHPFPVPVVAVAGHQRIKGVSNLVLDHDRAAELALNHLHSLGHRQIAFMRGHPSSSDAADRWRSTVKTARRLGLAIKSDLLIQLESDSITPAMVYPAVQQLLAGKRRFTALLSFNDIAAIGAIHAIHDAGLRVPTDISVVGFDDIRAAALISPSLTTVRQPLREMGWTASEYLLGRVQGTETFREQIAIYPDLTVRESTASVSLAAPAASTSGKVSKAANSRHTALRNRTSAVATD